MAKYVLFPLVPGSKKPAVKGWAEPDYEGVDPRTHEGPLGLRCDGLVVVDCDSLAALEEWRRQAGSAATTWVRHTPHGAHVIYEAKEGDPTGPAVDVAPDTDIRAGHGSYIVWRAPGYEDIKGFGIKELKQYPGTFPARTQAQLIEQAGEDWDIIPEGRRNATLAAFGGTFRRQGMSEQMIAKALLGLNRGICQPPLPEKEVLVIARSVCRYEPDPVFEIELADDEDGPKLLQWLADMELPPPPEWWWRPYLPKGRLVLLDGSEGIGKGLMCVHLAKLVADEGERVLWMSTEDDPEEDIQRRLLAAGVDHEAPIGFFTRDPKFPTHVDVLERLIEEHGAGLVVMDPGRSFLAPPEGSGGMSYNDEAHIRPGLESLNKLAKRSGCTILFVHHWNKNTQTTTQYRSGGSGAFAQVVRHRITLAWVGPTESGKGAFEVSKSNIGPKGHVHGYTVEAVEAFDTARFALGKSLDHPDLSSWMDAAAGGSITLDVSDIVTEDVVALAPGTPLPGAKHLVKSYPLLSADDAAELAEAWVRSGVAVLTDGKLYRAGEPVSV